MADVEPKSVKVFNLTDVETDNLKQRGLFEQHVAIVDRMCAPGEFVEVTDTPHLRATIKHLVQVGALAVDQLPPPYVGARSLRDSTQSRKMAAPAHLDVKETKVADPPPAQATEEAVATEAPPTQAPKKTR